MRIVVISPPRSGNHWIECLLGSIYQLQHFGGAKKPETTKVRDVKAWVDAGGFPEDTIFHLHCRFRPKLCDVIESVPAHIVTIARDPYDAFVSRYFWTQHRSPVDVEKAKSRPRQALVGKLLEDPEVLDFLEDDNGFGSHVRHSLEWVKSGRAIVVRYEDLHQTPQETLKLLTDHLKPVNLSRLDDAIVECSADRMRAQSATMAWNVRAAKVGDSKDKLSAPQLEVLRDKYADLIRDLGYDVRDPDAS
jgi:Sulfotransferase domain